MVWCSVFCLLLFFFPGQLQWNLHAEENTYCLRIIHNKHLKRRQYVKVKIGREIGAVCQWREKYCGGLAFADSSRRLYIVQENTCCLCIILETLRKTNLKQ